MKKYIILGIIIIIVLILFFLPEEEVKSEIKEEKVEEIKEEFKYSTVNHDNINELVKETVVEEVKVNYVVDMKNGLTIEDDNTYYYENGEKVINRVIDNMYFDENGIMVRNKEVNNKYYGEDGKLVLGEIEIEGNKYYYSENGKEKDVFIDDKYYDLEGIYVPNIKKENNNIYYYENEEIVKGIKKINNFRYYFDFDTGKLIKNNIKSVIDISTWQEDINFDELVNSNMVDGIIVRIGFGSLNGEDCTLDNKFERNINEIKRLGIPYGIYFYGYAQNEDAAKVEANFVSNMISKYELDLSFPIFYDAELTEFNGIKYTKKLYKSVINEFISVLNNNGYNEVGVYGNLKMLTKGSLSFIDNNIPIWVAQYNNTCEYEKDYVGWQYTSSGIVPGINTKVDMNIFY